jgi:histidinol-phosphate/aromatic aminotransferase/cobyric acid decarboxylase-like protein/adenosyl cobinamide kinase/adenosyl cobinamide phosphate guanylyltransferase
MSLTLVIGGVRSGKSARAEALASASGRPVRYVATADPADTSMAERIAAHAMHRPHSWTTVEADATLAGALRAGDGECVLVDGLGLWLARSLEAAGAFADDGAADGARATVSAEIDALVAAAARRPVIVVAEEAGLGTLPPERGTRLWLDLLGEAVQRLAAVAEHVEFVLAGRPIALASGAPASDARATPRDDPLREHGDRLVRPGDADHAVNVLAGGPPPWLREELARALAAQASTYPDETDAVAALAALHDREAEEIVPTNGAAQALWLLPAALRPALAACVHPGFTEGEAALRAHGVAVVRVARDPERGFALDPAAVPEAADLVLVGNPASPSGTLDPAAALLALRRPGRTVVVDEAFMDLVPGEPASLVRERLPDVVVVRSLTKSLSIPGLRAGYAVAARPLADRLRAVRPPWSVNALALAALAAAAARPAALAAAAERATREREDLVDRLAGIPRMRSWPSSANFCLVEVPDGPRVLRALRATGIAVRPAANFPGLGPYHLRLTARGPEENARLAEALAEAVTACP